MKNIIFPPDLEIPVRKTLAYYPEFESTHIEFAYRDNIRSSVMQAQPILSTVLRSAKKRKYLIRISRQFNLMNNKIFIRDLPEEVVMGWLGHELGHILDYYHRNFMALLSFGVGYLFSSHFIKGAEQTADEFAVQHGMGEYILATKNFILNHADLSDKYRAKIKRLYLSPEEIVSLINENEPVKPILHR